MLVCNMLDIQNAIRRASSILTLEFLHMGSENTSPSIGVDYDVFIMFKA